MTHLPLAFSIHHFISSVGADAGFASIIGLAILVLLYFAQARETSTLRERADGAEQHAAQLEARLSQVAQAARAQAQQAGPRPAPSPIARPLANPAAAGRTATATAAAPAAALAGPIPSAPPGVGAPALADATRLIPLPSESVAPQPQAVPAVAAPIAASASSELEAKSESPAPATAAGVAASAGGSRAAVAEPEALVGTGNGAGSDTIAHPLLDDPAEEPLPRVQLRSSASRARQLPPLTRPPSDGQRSRGARALAAVIGVLGVAAVIAVLLIVTSSGGKSSPNSTTSTTNAPSSRHKLKTAKVFNRAAVTVTVLNGTSTAGLAAHILQELGGQGYKQGSAANASSATQTTTIVSYVNGQKAAALQVAKSLNLAQSTVAPITSSTQSIACPQTSCNVDVVVTVGQDLASQ
jgi:hypothetical protein